MQIEKKFVVKAKPETVWVYFTDPTWIAACLPGAEINAKIDDKTYSGGIRVKVGPVATSYRGKVTFERLDPVARTAHIVASGQDVKGKGGADMKIFSQLVERSPGETEVTVVSEVNVHGILAQLGRGMIQEVSDQMFNEFTAAMSASLRLADASHRAPAPVAGVKTTPRAPLQIGASLLHRLEIWFAIVVAAGVAVWWLFLR